VTRIIDEALSDRGNIAYSRSLVELLYHCYPAAMMRLPHTSDSGHTLLIRVLKQLITAKHNTRLKLPKARKQLVAFIGILLEVCTERVCVWGTNVSDSLSALLAVRTTK
jgi:hypothetical protein